MSPSRRQSVPNREIEIALSLNTSHPSSNPVSVTSILSLPNELLTLIICDPVVSPASLLRLASTCHRLRNFIIPSLLPSNPRHRTRFVRFNQFRLLLTEESNLKLARSSELSDIKSYHGESHIPPVLRTPLTIYLACYHCLSLRPFYYFSPTESEARTGRTNHVNRKPRRCIPCRVKTNNLRPTNRRDSPGDGPTFGIDNEISPAVFTFSVRASTLNPVHRECRYYLCVFCKELFDLSMPCYTFQNRRPFRAYPFWQGWSSWHRPGNPYYYQDQIFQNIPQFYVPVAHVCTEGAAYATEGMREGERWRTDVATVRNFVNRYSELERKKSGARYWDGTDVAKPRRRDVGFTTGRTARRFFDAGSFPLWSRHGMATPTRPYSKGRLCATHGAVKIVSCRRAQMRRHRTQPCFDCQRDGASSKPRKRKASSFFNPR